MALTPAEQLLLELVNRMRLDPAAEASLYNTTLNANLTPGTLKPIAIQPLVHSDQLQSAADGHSQWMLDNGQFSHIGANDSTPLERAQAAGYNEPGQVGENLSARGTSGTLDLEAMVREQHKDLFISQNHRVNTLVADYGIVGMGQQAGQFTFDGQVLDTSMITQLFAENTTQNYITGVSYTDTDNDDFYSVGEGVSGIAVSAQGGNTTSTNTGGYGIGVTAAQSVNVTIDNATVAVDTSGGNVKLDLVDGTKILSSGNTTIVSGVSSVELLGIADLSLAGIGGSELLVGNRGNNVIRGGGGIDTVIGGDGDDVLAGGAEGDNIIGGAGNDAADYFFSAGFVNVSLATGYAGGGQGSDAIGDTFQSIENLVGSTHDDILSGSAGRNVLNGSDGNDMLRGRAGGDALIGGNGSDTAVYDDSSAFVNVSLASGYAGGGAGSHAIGDTFASVENLIGSRFGDLLSGDDGINVLTGGAGNDMLRGRAGGDTLNGGTGRDSADYADSTAWVNVSLASGYTGGGMGNHAAGDKFISIEDVTGSNFGDRLSGDGAANALIGRGGDDILRGRGGADTLNGGSGRDTADYADSAGFVNVSLATGYTGGGSGSHAIGDIFISIENLTGSAFGDRLNGDSGANVINGLGGNDILQGYQGADTFAFFAGFGDDTITDFVNGAELLDFRGNSQVDAFGDLTVSAVGNDALIGDSFGNSITILNNAGQINADDFLF